MAVNSGAGIALGGFRSSRGFRSGLGGRRSLARCRGHHLALTAVDRAAVATARGGSIATAAHVSSTTAARLRSTAGRGGGAAAHRLAASGLTTAAITHPLEQAAALVLATAADRLTADRLRLAASRRAATLAAEQAGGRFLIFAHHGKPDHGHQNGDRRQNDTIHLELLPRCNGKQKCTTPLTVEDSSVPVPPRRSWRGWVDALSLLAGKRALGERTLEVAGP